LRFENQETCFLSVLIPTFKNPVGVTQILDEIAPFLVDEIELVISDDSDDNSVSLAVAPYLENYPITYKKNENPLGASHNWNHLISISRGKFIWLLHHDDVPVGFCGFRDYILRLISESDRPEVIIFRSHVDFLSIRPSYGRFPQSIQNIVLKFPLLVLTGNFFGPPSVFVIDKRLGLDFDTRFRWKIDLEWYFRIFERFPKVSFVPMVIKSCYGGRFQISREFVGRTRRMAEYEEWRLFCSIHSIRYRCVLLLAPVLLTISTAYRLINAALEKNKLVKRFVR